MMINQFLQLWKTASQSEKKEIANFVAKQMQPQSSETARELLEFLNKCSKRKYRLVSANLRPIQARLNEGASSDEVKSVIARKCAEWANNPTMEQYLRPKTLFNATNFNNYLGQLDMKLPESPKPRLKRPPESDNAAWISLAKKVGAHNTATYDQIWSMAISLYDAGRLHL